MRKLLISTFAFAMLSAMPANAVPIVFSYTDTISTSNVLGVSPGDSWVVEVILDNGGSSLSDQVWSADDLVSGLFTAGSYFQSFDSQMCGSFSTDVGGAVASAFCGTFGANTDSYGSGGLTYLFNNAVRSSNGNLAFFTNGSMSSNPGSWTVRFAAVAEPGTLALLAIGLFGMGLARRRKTA